MNDLATVGVVLTAVRISSELQFSPPVQADTSGSTEIQIYHFQGWLAQSRTRCTKIYGLFCLSNYFCMYLGVHLIPAN